MSTQNNDELARILTAMSNGQVSDGDSDDQRGEGDESAPTFAGSPMPPSARSAAERPQSSPVLYVYSRYFHLRRTLIPILLTLGVICPTLVVLGMLASPISPYAVFAEWWFSIPILVIGVMMLGLGILTMLQVRNELRSGSS